MVPNVPCDRARWASPLKSFLRPSNNRRYEFTIQPTSKLPWLGVGSTCTQTGKYKNKSSSFYTFRRVLLVTGVAAKFAWMSPWKDLPRLFQGLQESIKFSYIIRPPSSHEPVSLIFFRVMYKYCMPLHLISEWQHSSVHYSSTTPYCTIQYTTINHTTV